MAQPRCRFCKASPEYQSVRSEFVYRGEKEHKFWQCDKCDLVYLWPVPSVEEEERFYTNEFERYMEKKSGIIFMYLMLLDAVLKSSLMNLEINMS